MQANPRVVYACTVYTENYRVSIREFWMIYRGPGFHAILWFGSSSTPSPLSSKQIVSLSQSSCVSPVELTGRWGKGWYGGGAKSYDIEKAWSLINHPILSAEYGHTGYCRSLRKVIYYRGQSTHTFMHIICNTISRTAYYMYNFYIVQHTHTQRRNNTQA